MSKKNVPAKHRQPKHPEAQRMALLVALASQNRKRGGCKSILAALHDWSELLDSPGDDDGTPVVGPWLAARDLAEQRRAGVVSNLIAEYVAEMVKPSRVRPLVKVAGSDSPLAPQPLERREVPCLCHGIVPDHESDVIEGLTHLGADAWRIALTIVDLTDNGHTRAAARLMSKWLNDYLPVHRSADDILALALLDADLPFEATTRVYFVMQEALGETSGAAFKAALPIIAILERNGARGDGTTIHDALDILHVVRDHCDAETFSATLAEMCADLRSLRNQIERDAHPEMFAAMDASNA